MNEALVYNRTDSKIPKKFIIGIILEIFKLMKSKRPAAVSVLIISKSEMKKLNKNWRGKNEAADELSFGLNSRKEEEFANSNIGMVNLGEIVVNETVVGDKKRLAEVLVHGLLHLLGYDHDGKIKETLAMERLEKNILKKLKF